MKEFVLTKDLNFTFGNCKNCNAMCCNGIHGTVYSQIILEEFEKVYKNFPILFIFGELGFVKPVVLLTNGKDFCPYLKEYKCTIYDKRPTVCRTYPLSPNLDNEIYIDLQCPEVNKDSNFIITKNKITPNFSNNIFNNYQDKYINTHFEFENLKKENFEKLFEIKNISFYKINLNLDSKYVIFHKKSLINLKKFNLNNLVK